MLHRTIRDMLAAVYDDSSFTDTSRPSGRFFFAGSGLEHLRKPLDAAGQSRCSDVLSQTNANTHERPVVGR